MENIRNYVAQTQLSTEVIATVTIKNDCPIKSVLEGWLNLVLRMENSSSVSIGVPFEYKYSYYIVGFAFITEDHSDCPFLTLYKLNNSPIIRSVESLK